MKNLIMGLLAKAFSFFEPKRDPQLPVVKLTPKHLQNMRDVRLEGYKPRAGQTWNPLLKYPRNESCFCGSGKKAKRCCLLEIEAKPTVSQEMAAEAAPLVRVLRGK